MTTGVMRSSGIFSKRCISGLDSTTHPSVDSGARAYWALGVPCSQMPEPVFLRIRSTALG